MSCGQQTDDLLAVFRVAEDGIEQAVELVFEPWIATKKNAVGIPFEALSFLEKTEVIRYAAKYHVVLHDVVTRQFNAFTFEIFLTFLQRERHELDFIGESPV